MANLNLKLVRFFTAPLTAPEIAEIALGNRTLRFLGWTAFAGVSALAYSSYSIHGMNKDINGMSKDVQQLVVSIRSLDEYVRGMGVQLNQRMDQLNQRMDSIMLQKAAEPKPGQ